MKYRKKPVEVEAMHIGTSSMVDVARWCGGRIQTSAKASDPSDIASWLEIPTLEGVMRASKGDYVIRGVKGEFYPCKADIFEATYEALEGDGKCPCKPGDLCSCDVDCDCRTRDKHLWYEDVGRVNEGTYVEANHD